MARFSATMPGTGITLGLSDVKNIILTGFMGTGKSSVGRLLAKRLGFRLVDLDAEIVRVAGCSINEIFAESGEEEFRRLESAQLDRLARGPRTVLSTGGGAVKNPDNRRLMHDAGAVINLTASVDAICARLVDDSARPLLRENRSPDFVARMLAEREQYYADADVRIDTSGKSVGEVVEEILVWLKRVGMWKA